MFGIGKKVTVEFGEGIKGFEDFVKKEADTVDGIYSEFDTQIRRLEALAENERNNIANREHQIAALIASKASSFLHAARADELVLKLNILKAANSPVVAEVETIAKDAEVVIPIVAPILEAAIPTAAPVIAAVAAAL